METQSWSVWGTDQVKEVQQTLSIYFSDDFNYSVAACKIIIFMIEKIKANIWPFKTQSLFEWCTLRSMWYEFTVIYLTANNHDDSLTQLISRWLNHPVCVNCGTIGQYLAIHINTRWVFSFRLACLISYIIACLRVEIFFHSNKNHQALFAASIVQFLITTIKRRRGGRRSIARSAFSAITTWWEKQAW